MQGMLTLVGIVASGYLGRLSARSSAQAAVRTAELQAGVQTEANDNAAAEAVVAGAIALSQGIRAELDAVRRDLDAERTASREQRNRMLLRIEQLETQHEVDAVRIDQLERENARQARELDAVKRRTRRPPQTRTRRDDDDTPPAMPPAWPRAAVRSASTAHQEDPTMTGPDVTAEHTAAIDSDAPAADDPTPEQSDNRPRVQDGDADLPEAVAADGALEVAGDADDDYDPDRDGI